MKIQLIEEFHLGEFYQHYLRHFAESGMGDEIIFHPSLEFKETSLEDFKKRFKANEVKKEGQRKDRVWGLFDEKGKIRGEISLHFSSMKSAHHRAKMSIGIEAEYRGKGFANQLMNVALEWAKNENNLDWIDLYVFAHNAKAISLYEKYGFKKLALKKDVFRVNGKKIDDMEMTLNLL